MLSIESTTTLLLIALLHDSAGSSLASIPQDKKRELFSIPSAFDYYHNVCKSHCGDVAAETEAEIPGHGHSINPCPKCEDKYSHEHCNRCCQGEASSLRLRWFGCEGNLSILEASDNVGPLKRNKNELEKIRIDSKQVGFLQCDCYDLFVKYGYLHDRCIVNTYLEGVSGDDDICIVSTSENSIDLTVPLPNPLIIFHNVTNKGPYKLDWHGELVTIFDTGCQTGEGVTVPPVPGYGKFANTPSTQGFIDLPKKQIKLPETIDYFSGAPPTEMFWYEIIDGTSTGFWPSDKRKLEESYFDPTFASCSCIECPSAAPSQSPTFTPSLPPSNSPSKSPSITPTSNPLQPPTMRPQELPSNEPTKNKPTTTRPTLLDTERSTIPSATPTNGETERNTMQQVLGCPPTTYEQCNEYASINCITKATGEICSFDFSAHMDETRRNLEILVLHKGSSGDVFEYSETEKEKRRETVYETLREHQRRRIREGSLSREEIKNIIAEERDYHLEQYRLFRKMEAH